MIFEIKFVPVFRPDTTLSLSRFGSCLIVNGASIDFSVLDDGGELPGDVADSLHELVAYEAIKRTGDTVSLSLVQPYSRVEPWTGPSLIVAVDGPVALPFGVADPVPFYVASTVTIPTDGVINVAERDMETLRAERNARLLRSDYTQLPDFPGDPLPWQVYRQALRDLPENPNPEWPNEPN